MKDMAKRRRLSDLCKNCKHFWSCHTEKNCAVILSFDINIPVCCECKTFVPDPVSNFVNQ